jgi:hypothetical protein
MMRQQAQVKRGPRLTETEVDNDPSPGPTILPQTQPAQTKTLNWRQKIFRTKAERSIARKKSGMEHETTSPQQTQETMTTPPVQETVTSSAVQIYAASETSFPKPAGPESMPGYGSIRAFKGIKGVLMRKTKP